MAAAKLSPSISIEPSYHRIAVRIAVWPLLYLAPWSLNGTRRNRNQIGDTTAYRSNRRRRHLMTRCL